MKYKIKLTKTIMERIFVLVLLGTLSLTLFACSSEPDLPEGVNDTYTFNGVEVPVTGDYEEKKVNEACSTIRVGSDYPVMTLVTDTHTSGVSYKKLRDLGDSLLKDTIYYDVPTENYFNIESQWTTKDGIKCDLSNYVTKYGVTYLYSTGYSDSAKKGYSILIKLDSSSTSQIADCKKILKAISFDPADCTIGIGDVSSSSAASDLANDSSSSSNSTVSAFNPNQTYKQGDIAKFSGYSLGGETTVDQDTGKKGAVIFFSTNKSSSTKNAQAILLLDTVRATTAGVPVECTAVCAAINEDGVPIFTEM